MKIVHRDNYKPLTTTYNKNDVIEAALNWSEVYKQVGRIDFIENWFLLYDCICGSNSMPLQ